MDQLFLEDLQKVFARLKDMAQENRDYLIELDGVMGDSDLGLTMVSAFTAANETAQAYSGNELGELLLRAGMSMSKAAPSTMGTLMATGFMRGGKSIKSARIVGLAELCVFWEAFVKGLMDRGKSAPGDKTIIDALFPAMLAIKNAEQNNENLCVAMKLAATAAANGVDSTKTMVAQHGRAAYYGEKSRSAQDPGATIGSLMIEVFADVICDNSK